MYNGSMESDVGSDPSLSAAVVFFFCPLNNVFLFSLIPSGFMKKNLTVYSSHWKENNKKCTKSESDFFSLEIDFFFQSIFYFFFSVIFFSVNILIFLNFKSQTNCNSWYRALKNYRSSRGQGLVVDKVKCTGNVFLKSESLHDKLYWMFICIYHFRKFEQLFSA